MSKYVVNYFITPYFYVHTLYTPDRPRSQPEYVLPIRKREQLYAVKMNSINEMNGN